MQILVAVFGAVMLGAVVLSMFGIVNLPLGPLNGMLAGEEDVTVEANVDVNTGGGAGAGLDAGAGASPCPPGYVLESSLGGASTATDPAAGAATEPGATGDPAATDPAATAPAGTDPAATTPAGTDPNAAVVGAPSGVDADVTRVLAAGRSSDVVSDTPVYAAEIAPVSETPATVTDSTGAADAATTSATIPPGCVPDPAAAGGAGASAGAGSTGSTGSAGAATRVVVNGENSGNSPEALRMATDAAGVMEKAKITVAATGTLLPATGGASTKRQLVRYRSTVVAAALVIKLTDPNSQQQWTSAGKATQIKLVRGFITRLGAKYKRAVRSVTIVDPNNTLLAVGDATAGKRAAVVKIY
jgi:hypothetical protein